MELAESGGALQQEQHRSVLYFKLLFGRINGTSGDLMICVDLHGPTILLYVLPACLAACLPVLASSNKFALYLVAGEKFSFEFSQGFRSN